MGPGGPLSAALRYIVSTYGQGKPPPGGPAKGSRGFNGGGSFDLAVGTVTGYRWWVLPPVALWNDELRLKGATGRYLWQPGLNEAGCNFDRKHWPPVEYDSRAGRPCGCGFWAYWTHADHQLGMTGMPVTGVVRGSGRTLIGELGFRCQQAEIIALHVPLEGVAGPLLKQAYGKSADRALQVGGAHLTAGGVQSFRAITGHPAIPDREIEKLRRAAEREALVRISQAETWLERTYPDAEICATLGYLTMKYPPAGRP